MRCTPDNHISTKIFVELSKGMRSEHEKNRQKTEKVAKLESFHLASLIMVVLSVAYDTLT